MNRIAITGINSYLAKALMPKLEADPEIAWVVGVDVAPWESRSGKVDFHQEDVRSPKLAEILKGVDIVVHLAFIVQEIHVD